MKDKDSVVVERRYTVGQLTEIMNFWQQDFARFLAMLIWLEDLTPGEPVAKKHGRPVGSKMRKPAAQEVTQ